MTRRQPGERSSVPNGGNSGTVRWDRRLRRRPCLQQPHKREAILKMIKARADYTSNSSAILVVRYEGAYGDTLRIDIQELDGLSKLVVFLRTFCDSGESETSLKLLPGRLFAPPLTDLRMKKTSSNNFSATSEDRNTVIKWSQPPKGWHDTLGLVEGLELAAGTGQSGHQYLTEFEKGILIELAFNE